MRLHHPIWCRGAYVPPGFRHLLQLEAPLQNLPGLCCPRTCHEASRASSSKHLQGSSQGTSSWAREGIMALGWGGARTLRRIASGCNRRVCACKAVVTASWQSKAGRRVLAIATVIHTSSLESFCPISKNDAYHTHAFLLLSGENASPGVMPSA